MRPYIKYFGGKHNLARFYGPPRRKVVVEPFAGGAGYSTYWEPDKVFLIEKYDKLAAVWEWLIGATHDDIMDIPAPVYDVNDYDFPPAVRDFIGWNLGWGDENPRRTMTEVTQKWVAKRESGIVWGPTKRLWIANQIHKINNWEILSGDYTSAPVGDFHYHVDPPYMYSGTKYAKSSKHLDFEALAEWCKSKSCIDVCEGYTPDLNPKRTDWLPFEVLKYTTNGQGHFETANGKQSFKREELIWRQGMELSPLFRAVK